MNSCLVVLLDKAKIQIYGGGLPGVLTYDFPQTVSKDLEILDVKKLSDEIKKSLSQYKLEPCNAMLVLSPTTYFEKDLVSKDKSSLDKEISDFVDVAPFEEVASKIYTVASGQKLIVTNLDFIEKIKSVFEEIGFPTAAIVPQFVTGSETNNLDDKLGRIVTKSAEGLTARSILSTEIKGIEKTQSTSSFARYRIYLFMAIFVALVLTLLFLVFRT